MVNKPGHRLSIIGIGSDQGAPIPLPKGGFLKDNKGTITVPQRDRPQLMKLAQDTGGLYSDLTVDGKDLKVVLPKSNINDTAVQVEREFDQWHDAGYWLVLLLLPLALVGFRKGWLVAVFAMAILPAQHSEAFEWQDLWKTSDQQAMESLNNKKPDEAATRFERTDWKGEALYQSDNFEGAAKEFAKSDTATGFYNQGNALRKPEAG